MQLSGSVFTDIVLRAHAGNENSVRYLRDYFTAHPEQIIPAVNRILDGDFADYPVLKPYLLSVLTEIGAKCGVFEYVGRAESVREGFAYEWTCEHAIARVVVKYDFPRNRPVFLVVLIGSNAHDALNYKFFPNDHDGAVAFARAAAASLDPVDFFEPENIDA